MRSGRGDRRVGVVERLPERRELLGELDYFVVVPGTRLEPAALQQDGCAPLRVPEIFEQTVSAAVSAGLERLDAGLEAIR